MVKVKLQSFQLVTLAAWVSRGIQAVLQVLMIAIITRILNVEEYAVYILITGLMSWFMLADIGMGIALQNKISELKAQSIDFNVYIVNTVLIICFLFLIFLILFYFISDFIASIYLQNVLNNSDSGFNFFISSVLMISTALFSLVYKVWYALEKGYWSSIVPAFATIISFLLMLSIDSYLSDVENPILVVLIAYLLPIAMFPFFFFVQLLVKMRKKIVFSKQISLWMFRKGLGFFYFGLMSALVLQIDYIIISQTLTPEDIVEYNILAKIFGLGFFIYSALLLALWPVVSEKIANGESHLVMSFIKIYLPIGLIFMSIFTILIFVFSKPILSYLITNTVVDVTVGLVILFGFYYIIRIWTDTFSMVLQSANKLKPFWLIVPIQALLSISFQLFFSRLYGLEGIVIALILSFILSAAWYLPVKAMKLIKENKGHA